MKKVSRFIAATCAGVMMAAFGWMHTAHATYYSGGMPVATFKVAVI